jgi:hypothetical protein
MLRSMSRGVQHLNADLAHLDQLTIVQRPVGIA